MSPEDRAIVDRLLSHIAFLEEEPNRLHREISRLDRALQENQCWFCRERVAVSQAAWRATHPKGWRELVSALWEWANVAVWNLRRAR